MNIVFNMVTYHLCLNLFKCHYFYTYQNHILHLLTCLSISFLALNADRASAFIVKVNKGKYDTHVDMISIHAEINSECFLFPYNNNNSIEQKKRMKN